ncbi:hypothetical protein DPX16_2870 [Scomber scombrus]|uniref:Uncharacterized protein n=1 Tax=Scomber scombrus TaxID=13677 RepID=A0AAV1PIT9_SCOSC
MKERWLLYRCDTASNVNPRNRFDKLWQFLRVQLEQLQITGRPNSARAGEPGPVRNQRKDRGTEGRNDVHLPRPRQARREKNHHEILVIKPYPACSVIGAELQSSLSLSRSDPGQVRELQSLLNPSGERHCDLDKSPSAPSGQQELFRDSSLFLSSYRLVAMHQASKEDCLHLFHFLFDYFFSVEDFVNSSLDTMRSSPRERESLTSRGSMEF